MLQLIYELRKNWRGRVDGWTGRDGTSKVLQEVLADQKSRATFNRRTDNNGQLTKATFTKDKEQINCSGLNQFVGIHFMIKVEALDISNISNIFPK